MAIGERNKSIMGTDYLDSPLAGLTSQYIDTLKTIRDECRYDMFTEAAKVLTDNVASDALEEFFVENCCDPESFRNTRDYDEYVSDMHEMYLNEKDALLQEATNISSYNAVQGLIFPLQKNLTINCVFDKGAIPKEVAKSPKFTFTMENRYLVKPDGTRIDVFRQQDQIYDALRSSVPEVEIELKLPEYEQTDILEKVGASSMDDINAIDAYISAVKVTLEKPYNDGEKLPDGTLAKGTVKEAWYPVRDFKFVPSYGEYDRSLIKPIEIVDEHVNAEKRKDTISGIVKNNRFQISSLKGNVTAVKLVVSKDTQNNMLPQCSVMWDARTDIVEIGNGIPISCTISPQEVKDLSALYNVNQLTKIMEIMNLVLENQKDDDIRHSLDRSYKSLDPRQKDFGVFDFAPKNEYQLDPVSWRQAMFFDVLQSHVTNMLQVLNDPNMVVTVFGRPDLIRKIEPQEHVFYKSPENIGPVELEYSKVVQTTGRITYQFISSQKLKNTNELIIILCPRNTNRVVYKIFDWQLYLSNEIRNPQNPTLPNITAFQRYKLVEYQPVQGRFRILNPMGLREGKDIPTLGSVGAIGQTYNNPIMGPTVPKGAQDVAK